MKTLTLLFFSILTLQLCHSAEVKDEVVPPKSILFIGNSYTAGIAKAFKAILRRERVKAKIKFITRGAATMEDHYKSSSVRSLIKRKEWDYVILQGQSSEALPILVTDKKTKKQQLSYDPSFINSSTQLHKLIKAKGAQTIFFMTWAYKASDFSKRQAEIAKSYNLLAQKLNADVSPVGLVWQEIRKQKLSLSQKMYTPDNSHASRVGNYATALTFYCKIYDTSAQDVKHTHRVKTSDYKIIKTAVDTVLSSIKEEKLRKEQEQKQKEQPFNDKANKPN